MNVGVDVGVIVGEDVRVVVSLAVGACFGAASRRSELVLAQQMGGRGHSRCFVGSRSSGVVGGTWYSEVGSW